MICWQAHYDLSKILQLYRIGKYTCNVLSMLKELVIGPLKKNSVFLIYLPNLTIVYIQFFPLQFVFL